MTRAVVGWKGRGRGFRSRFPRAHEKAKRESERRRRGSLSRKYTASRRLLGIRVVKFLAGVADFTLDSRRTDWKVGSDV